ncbi:type III secretion system inner membrane ring subunit SctD [Variovorax sp. PBL-E5]|uniref:type III secretion system inner membrane ring subunit SctD n=1 Tax=Variovorax sp. PBL-E5 TaxID=434014 RepID=UPI001316233D|nr:type III secretion system inner membrane ring subunit SctD [Variovorax sp. PBL-E5]VTU16415.1 type III secretion apparatus protein, YscD/HrpQ family [Variovorax sp. PBL-E5]
MTSDSTTPIELRVLYGPQAGSRLQLASGDYLIGCSDECAIVLSGLRMAQRHALLVVQDEEARIAPQDGTVCDAMGNAIADELVLALGMPVELGGVSIAIDRVDAAWPDAQAVAPMRDAASAPVEAATAASSATTAPAAGGLRSSPAALRRARGVSLIAMGIAALALLGLAFAWALDGESAAAPQPEIASVAAPGSGPPEALTGLLRTLDPAHALTLTRQANDQWLVSGYVATGTEKKTLMDGLADLTPVPALKIFSEEEITKAANEVLNAKEDASDGVLAIENGGKGLLRLSGAVRHAVSAQSAKLSLMIVPGVSSVDISDVMLPEKLLADLKGRIDAAGLRQQLVFTSEWPTVTLTGSVDETQRARWETLIRAFTQAYGDVLPLHATLTPAVPKAMLEVRTIVGGDAPYIVTRQGVRVNRGGEIDGHVLSMVRDTDVVFDGAQRWQIAR